MIAITADDVQHYEKICQKIIELDPKIRFVGVITQMGKLVAGRRRPGIKLLVNQDKREMLFMEVALRIRMRHEFDLTLGPVNYTITHRDKVVVMSIPYRNKFLYLSAESDIDLCGTPQKIIALIREA